MARKPQRWLIFGAGMQGRAVAFDAIRYYGAEVLLLDPSISQLLGVQDMLIPMLGQDERNKLHTRLTYRRDESGGVEGLMNWADVVVSCAPHSANVAITTMAVIHRVPYCDLGGSPRVVGEQASLATRLGAETAVIVPDCGVSPGISNILAVHLAKDLGCDTVHVRCGSNPLEPPDARENPWLYKLLFNPEGLAEEYTGYATVVCDGKLVPIRALSYIQTFERGLESAPTSNNSHFTAQALRELGVHTYDYQTIRHHGHFAAVLQDQGGEVEVSKFLGRVRAMSELVFDREKDRDRMILVVEGSRRGRSLQRTNIFRYDFSSDPAKKFTAMELMTSWGISLVAYRLATRRDLRGFMFPWECVDAEWMFAEIDRRLKVHLS